MPRPDHFGFLAPLYDRVISAPRGDQLVRLAELPHQALMLDVGGGTGRIAEGMVGRVGSVVVADESRGMLLQAIQKPGLLAVQSLAEGLPFASGTVERVIVVDVYHHLADQEKALEELWRVLAPGGLLIIEEPDINHPAVKLVALAERLLLMRSRFVRSERIAADLIALGAHVDVVEEQHTYWVVGRKG
jgi:demethylmenaquinone methyltransferase/2-methoxy-6-polyprenyl-1,4-benzoquinol methylase